MGSRFKGKPPVIRLKQAGRRKHAIKDSTPGKGKPTGEANNFQRSMAKRGRAYKDEQYASWSKKYRG